MLPFTGTAQFSNPYPTPIGIRFCRGKVSARLATTRHVGLFIANNYHHLSSDETSGTECAMQIEETRVRLR